VAPSVVQAVCVDGGLTAPTLTTAETDGITYTVVPAGPYSQGQSVTVTATLDPEDVGWPGVLPGGWVETSDTTAELVVTFAAVACTPVTPVDPVVEQATCAAGVVTVPTVTPTPVTGISYEVDPAGPYDGTEDTTVTVTATLADGFAWTTPAPDGWTYPSGDRVTATFTTLIVGTTCEEVTPVAPTNHSAVCTDGTLTDPTLTLPLTDGITYGVDAEPPYAPGQTVVVTATLDETDVGWPDELPPEWTETSETTATYTHEFADVACMSVVPVAPAVTAGTCVDDVVVASTIELATTPGVIYSVEPAGPYDPTGDTDVVVTATVMGGFAWDGPAAAPDGFVQRELASSPNGAPPPVTLPEGWTYVSPTEATYAVTLPAAPVCPQVAPTTTAPSSTVAAPTTTAVAPTTAAAPTTTSVAPTTPEAEDLTILVEAPSTTVAAPTTSTQAEQPTTTSTQADQPTTTSPGSIPVTGATAVGFEIVVALLVLTSGVLLVLIGRRRTTS
jgi:hypothetical protein